MSLENYLSLAAGYLPFILLPTSFLLVKETHKMSVAKSCLSLPDGRKHSQIILAAILKFLKR